MSPITPFKAYIDTGGMHKDVRELESLALLSTYYYPFEQRSKRVRHFVPGSGATFDQGNLSFDEEVGSFDDELPSDKFDQILAVTGSKKVDAQHLDSAHKTGCALFLTSDKTDIWSKRSEIWTLLGVHVLHMPSEAGLLRLIAQHGHALGKFAD